MYQRFIALTIALACVSFVRAENCVNEPLGYLKYFNLVVLNDLDHHDTETHGRVAVGRNAKFQSYKLGSKINPQDGGMKYALIVDGNLNFTDGTLWNAPIAVGGNASFVRAGYNETSRARDDIHDPENYTKYQRVLDFRAVETALGFMSKYLPKETPNGVTIPLEDEVLLSGSNALINVFSLDGKLLESRDRLTLKAPAGSTALINISGQSLKIIDELKIKLVGVTEEKIIYNFYEADSIDVNSVSFKGTVLARRASINYRGGRIDGSLFANNLTGTVPIYQRPFDGCLPSPFDTKR